MLWGHVHSLLSKGQRSDEIPTPEQVPQPRPGPVTHAVPTGQDAKSRALRAARRRGSEWGPAGERVGAGGLAAPPHRKAAPWLPVACSSVRTEEEARRGRSRPPALAAGTAMATLLHFPPPPLPALRRRVGREGRGGAVLLGNRRRASASSAPSPLPPFTYISPAEKEVGEGQESRGEATWWPRVSSPFSMEAGPSGQDDVLFPFGLQVLCPVLTEGK